jgi:uncharacterized glyoxalase superfamily protein PhnB
MTKTRENSSRSGGIIIPAIRYHDANAAIAWLSRAFGFTPTLVVPGEGGGVAHAQLRLGNGMIMLSSVRDDPFAKLLRTPAQVGGVGTFCGYVVVPDADAHHHGAVAAGARVVYPLTDEDYGGRGYSCLDLEGHLWSFGTYDPWKEVP